MRATGRPATSRPFATSSARATLAPGSQVSQKCQLMFGRYNATVMRVTAPCGVVSVCHLQRPRRARAWVSENERTLPRLHMKHKADQVTGRTTALQELVVEAKFCRSGSGLAEGFLGLVMDCGPSASRGAGNSIVQDCLGGHGKAALWPTGGASRGAGAPARNAPAGLPQQPHAAAGVLAGLLKPRASLAPAAVKAGDAAEAATANRW